MQNSYNLTNIKPLDLFLSFYIENIYIDLHNDFVCSKVEIAGDDLIFHFKQENKRALLTFKDFVMEDLNLLLLESLPGYLDNLSKTTLKPENNKFKNQFVISFVNGREYFINAETASFVLLT